MKAWGIMDQVIESMQETWDHISRGPVSALSIPEIALHGVVDALLKMKDYFLQGSPQEGEP